MSGSLKNRVGMQLLLAIGHLLSLCGDFIKGSGTPFAIMLAPPHALGRAAHPG